MRSLFSLVIMVFLYAPLNANAADCEQPIIEMSGLLEEIVGKKYILFGEMHGTEEIPRIIGDTACHLGANNKSILIALEMQSDSGDLARRYINDPSNSHFDALIQHQYWHPPMHDGRRSRAVLTLIKTLADLKAQGYSIDLIGADWDSERSNSISNVDELVFRDPEMAARIYRAQEGKGYDHVRILAGAKHVRVRPYQSFHALNVPIGAFFPPSNVLSLRFWVENGMAWQCAGPYDAIECGAFPADHPPMTTHIVDRYQPFLPEENKDYNGYIVLSKSSASPPAVESLFENKEKD